MDRKWTAISTAEEALKVILALSKGERARLFDLMARRPELVHFMMPPPPKQLGFEAEADFEERPTMSSSSTGAAKATPALATAATPWWPATGANGCAAWTSKTA